MDLCQVRYKPAFFWCRRILVEGETCVVLEEKFGGIWSFLMKNFDGADHLGLRSYQFLRMKSTVLVVLWSTL